MTIKELRASLNLSQNAFAKKLGIGVSTVGSYENGRIKPSQKLIDKIKEVFDIDLNGAAPVEEKAAPAVEEKAKPEKKTRKAPAKKAKKAEEKKAEPAPVEEEKKAEPALVEEEKTAEPAPVAEEKKAAEIIIQSPMGGEITPEAILAKIGEADKVYIRVDENKAYWVRGEESGSVDLW